MSDTEFKSDYNKRANRPNLVARMKHGHGKATSFENIGVGWERDDRSFYVKLHGTQIIDKGFYVFPTSPETRDDGPDI
jgi:hypothetical protein